MGSEKGSPQQGERLYHADSFLVQCPQFQDRDRDMLEKIC